jgi:prepilin-type N-terminal cleavage/methylation domain-containing protein
MKSGFTLIELMVVAALFAIISVIGGDILVTVFRAYSKATITSEIERNGNYAISLINYEIKGATDLQLTGGGSCTANANECLKYTDSKGISSEINFIADNCPTRNGVLNIVKGGTTSSITNSSIPSGVNVALSASRMFSLVEDSGVTYVGFTTRIENSCSQSIIGSARFDTIIKVRGY